MERVEVLAIEVRREIPVWLVALVAILAIVLAVALVAWFVGAFEVRPGVDVGSWRWRSIRVA
jgi:hypothetical protein